MRWFDNFERRHGGAALRVVDGRLAATGADGSTATAALPLDGWYGGAADPEAFALHVVPRTTWGMLLVRKGGFAVARLDGTALVDHKVGQRHVQGRTKAGGQSQQRFARRRDNQASVAYAAAADHAARVLGGGLEALVVGGDRAAVDAVLADPRLAGPRAARCSRWLAVPDPRRSVLDAAIRDAVAAEVRVVNAPEGPRVVQTPLDLGEGPE